MSQLHYDALGHWTQASAAEGAQLVRILSCQQANRYTARPVGFASDGSTQLLAVADMIVTNLAEAANVAGSVPANTDALAIDAGGRWVVFIRLVATASSSTGFVAKVISSSGGARYTVREQVNQGGSYQDRSGVADVSADNLAEMSLGPGAAVDAGTIVLVQGVADSGSPPTLRYAFDHPLYAKYLD